MKRLFLIINIILFFGVTMLSGQNNSLSPKATVSLLVCSPYEGEVFTLYGHAALRVNDPEKGLDLVFNYGIFDFDTPNFIYRFAKGQTDYQLGINRYNDYVIEYQMRGSEVTELMLNLSGSEKEKLWNALRENYKRENRIYRYNFFFDNCATRPIAMIERQVDGQIKYPAATKSVSFRELINECTQNHPWLTFGCDLALGSPTDRIATPHEQMFLPMILKSEVSKAMIVRRDGTEEPLVSKVLVLTEADEETAGYNLFTPLFVSILLLGITVFVTALEIKKKTCYRFFNTVLFSCAGIAGCVLFFLSFISEHPCVFPNWNLLWLHPLHLLGAVIFSVKKGSKAAYYYHFINFVPLSAFILFGSLLPQYLNAAFFPFAGCLWVRSGSYILNVWIKK